MTIITSMIVCIRSPFHHPTGDMYVVHSSYSLSLTCFNRFTVCSRSPPSSSSSPRSFSPSPNSPLSGYHLSLQHLVSLAMTTISTSTSRLSDAEKLTADNYGSWRQRVYGLMLRTRLWSIVNSTIPTPADFPDAAARLAWEEKDGQALGEIIGSLSTGQLINISECKHAHEAWVKLEELHRPKSSQNFVYVRTKLDRTRLEETSPGTMQAHIGELRDVMNQLTNLGEPVSDKAAAVHLLNSIMHKDYSTVVAILSNGPMADLTFDKVAVTLLGEERRLTQQEAVPTTTTHQGRGCLCSSARILRSRS